MPKQLLRSYFPIRVRPSALNESKSKNGGKVILDGLIQMAETPNGNGRIYPRSILEREVNRYKDVIAQNRALGELDHPPEKDWERDDPLQVRLDRASHMIVDIRMEGNEVRGTVQVLSTPAGQILEALINDGVTLGISSRGFGSVQHNGKHSIVQDDIEISCWDMVWMPSTTQAFMECLKENQTIWTPSHVGPAQEPTLAPKVVEPMSIQSDEDAHLVHMLRQLRSIK